VGSCAGSIFVRETTRLAALTVRNSVPAIYENRDFVAAGGLMSYGADIFENYRLVGVYTGRVLKGENPAEFASPTTG
jgi:putative ABC transport system substrate-binding protein